MINKYGAENVIIKDRSQYFKMTGKEDDRSFDIIQKSIDQEDNIIYVDTSKIKSESLKLKQIELLCRIAIKENKNLYPNVILNNIIT